MFAAHSVGVPFPPVEDNRCSESLPLQANRAASSNAALASTAAFSAAPGFSRTSTCEPSTSGHPPRTVLILSAGVGHGHHAAAQGLRDELKQIAPDARVSVNNGLGRRHTPLRRFLERFIRWQLTHCPRAYSLSYSVGVRSRLGRRLTSRLLYHVSRKQLGELIQAASPDVIVSTYPGITAPLGEMRQRGELSIPVCALITDLTSLYFWAHPSIDLHLASYPQSLPEIASLTAGARTIAIEPPLSASHWSTQTPREARHKLGLDPHAPLVLITGGGWGLGDLAGAIEGAVELDDARVITVCGENSDAARQLSHRYRSQSRVRILGYTEMMADLLAAADALVHGTAGVTCLEAAAHNCPVISYGLAVGHIRHNTDAMVDHGLIFHAVDSRALTRRLRDLTSRPRKPRACVHRRPSAGSAVLGLGAPASVTSLRQNTHASIATASARHPQLGSADLPIVVAPPQ